MVTVIETIFFVLMLDLTSISVFVRRLNSSEFKIEHSIDVISEFVGEQMVQLNKQTL